MGYSQRYHEKSLSKVRLSTYNGFGGSKVERTGNGVVQHVKRKFIDVAEEGSNEVYM